jgi:hypothetical protein
MRIRAILTAALAAALLLPVAVSPAQAQQPPTEQEILERLRRAGIGARPDSATADTAAAAVRPAAGRAPARAGAARGAPASSTMQRDSVMESLMRLPGYVVTEYTAERARYDTDSSRLELRGTPEVFRDGQRFTADSTLIFWERRNLACGFGNPTVSGGDLQSPLAGDTLCYDVNRNYGMVLGARTEISEGAVWFVRGDLFTDGDAIYSHDAFFTDCDLEEPHTHYGFTAKRVKILPGRTMVARDVTMYFGDVPVMRLPFFAQSLSQGRRTGLLMPRFGVNDIVRNSSSYNRRVEDVGFYLALSDHLGAEMALDWLSDNWTGLRGSLDYNFRAHFLRGGLTYRQFWQAAGGRQFTLATNSSWQPDERTNVRMNANYATSSAFIREQSFDPRELNRSIDSNAGLQRRFSWGSLSADLSRRQQLHDGTVHMTLPSAGLNLTSITLFRSQPGADRWFSNATWTASARTRVDHTEIAADNPSMTLQGRRQVQSSATSAFNVGRFSWSQDVSLADNTRFARELPVDTLPALPQRGEQQVNWRTSLSYQQRLIGSTTLTPSVNLRGATLRADTTGGETVAGPMRMDLSSSLRTDVFGFWPGVGPFDAVRHKISPAITYSYSPTPTITDRQREVFPIGEIREQNRITLNLSQTFEARLRTRPEDRPTVDTLAVEPDTTTGPRRRPQAQRMMLLGLSTDAMAYDFVAARNDGWGFQTTQIGHTVQSDLLRGLQLSFAHDLFRTVRRPGTDEEGNFVPGERRFEPHLSRLNASFMLNSDSWIFRLLGLGRRDAEVPAESTPAEEEAEMEAGFEDGRREGALIGRGRAASALESRPVGQWSAFLSYSLLRPRGVPSGGGNQLLTGTMSFQPTENWAVNWRTGYSFSTGQFTDHVLTLTRRMHDWDANFDFYKAQNGNFSFMFRVQLRANPDFKLDYEQRDRSATRGASSQF